MQLQVDNTTRCCQAVTNGDVDIAVVGGAIPSALEHLVQVGAGLADLCIKPEPYTPEQAAASSFIGASGGIMQQSPYLVPAASFCRGGAPLAPCCMPLTATSRCYSVPAGHVVYALQNIAQGCLGQ